MQLRTILNIVIIGSIILLLTEIVDFAEMLFFPGYGREIFFAWLIEMMAPVSIIVFAIALKGRKNINLLANEPTNNEHI